LAPAVPEEPITGGCLCGGVRYEIDEPLLWAAYCHCTRCQRRTGTGSGVSARVARGALRFLTGEQLLRGYRPPEGGWEKVFCSRCGSAVVSRDPGDPEVCSVRMGTLDGDPGIRASRRQFVAYAAPWEPIPDDGLERFPERAP
jgi:hypothetical protein